MVKFAGWLLRHFQSFESCAVNEDETCIDWLESGVSFEWDVFEACQSYLERI
jgi:hypothetical protein